MFLAHQAVLPGGVLGAATLCAGVEGCCWCFGLESERAERKEGLSVSRGRHVPSLCKSCCAARGSAPAACLLWVMERAHTAQVPVPHLNWLMHSIPKP